MHIITAQEIKSTFNIAIVASRFNPQVTEALCHGCVDRLKELSFSNEQITIIWVPGVVEIPITAKRLAKTRAYEVIICLGAVIHGETDNYEYICQQVSLGCQQVALSEDIPLVFGILTTDNLDHALARCGGAHGHKGRDAADTAYEMVSVLRQIEI